MVFSNNSSHDGKGDCFHECFFTEIMKFLSLYYVPALIFTGMLALLVSRFYVIIAPTVKIAFVWNVMPCNLVRNLLKKEVTSRKTVIFYVLIS
jgi:hypothetical protein